MISYLANALTCIRFIYWKIPYIITYVTLRHPGTMWVPHRLHETVPWDLCDEATWVIGVCNSKLQNCNYRSSLMLMKKPEVFYQSDEAEVMTHRWRFWIYIWSFWTDWWDLHNEWNVSLVSLYCTMTDIYWSIKCTIG